MKTLSREILLNKRTVGDWSAIHYPVCNRNYRLFGCGLYSKQESKIG